MLFFRLILFYIISKSLPAFLCAQTNVMPPYKFTEKCMGTDFTILIDHKNFNFAKKVASGAFKKANQLNKIFSDYDSSSENSRLFEKSGNGTFQKVSDEFYRVLTASQILARETNGAFDITVGPYSRLWRIARFRKSLPDQQSILLTGKRVGWQNIIINSETKQVKLAVKNMVLDFGGIAKGYAADVILNFLKSQNANRVLIDAGGDLLLGAPPANKFGWDIKIGGKKHSELPTLSLSNIAVATSGDFEQFVTLGGKKYSHLIDPKTGIGLTNRAQVTVIAPSAIEADSLASASLVLGSRNGIKFLNTKKNVSAFFLEEIGNKTILVKTESSELNN
jgi:thiamine biosynthesis lipoprotein